MELENQLQGQIAKVLIRFSEIHLRATPRAALVDIHEHSIVVTLEDILPPVERDYARDEKGYDLLDESYTRMFGCMRRMAEIELELILGRRIRNSILRVDPESGNALLLFNLADGLGGL